MIDILNLLKQCKALVEVTLLGGKIKGIKMPDTEKLLNDINEAIKQVLSSDDLE